MLDEDVFRLEVAVDNVVGVEVLESAEDLGEVESDDDGAEDLLELAMVGGMWRSPPAQKGSAQARRSSESEEEERGGMGGGEGG